jgi:single-strand DNA-binding protein
MQTVIGRVTADAKINTLEDGRQVVNFTIAKNDRFKPKGSDTYREVTNFYSCSYWMGTGVADLLKKGALIEVTGRIGINVYNNLQGEAKGSLTLHVNYLKKHAKAKEDAGTGARVVNMNEPPVEEPVQDLPF